MMETVLVVGALGALGIAYRRGKSKDYFEMTMFAIAAMVFFISAWQSWTQPG